MAETSDTGVPPDRKPDGPGKTELVFQRLRSGIIDGRYGPGYRLVISALAKELGTSAVPVREAIRRLEAEGLVVFERHVGARVAALDVTDWEATMYVLAFLEGYTTALAAPRISADDLEQARSMNGRMKELLEKSDPFAFSRLNKDFHLFLYRFCPNVHLVNLTRREWDRLDAMRTSIFLSIPARARQSVAEHDELLDLIAAEAAPTVIEEFARRHKLSTKAAYLSENQSNQAGGVKT